MFGEIIGSVLGGLLGGGGSEQSQTSNKIDDRLAPYVYGSNGTGGLLGDSQALYKQQLAQGGLNDLQRSGLESQRQVYASPQYTQGYDAMRSMGLGLMGGGVAGNPFTSGASTTSTGSTAGAPSVVRPNTNLTYTPYTPQQTASLQGMNTPIQSVAQYQQGSATTPDTRTVEQMIDDYMKANKLGQYANAGTWQDAIDDRGI